jgi:uncharacterized protein
MLELRVVSPDPAPQRYKPSRFNHFHTLPSGERLAYNSLSNALAVLDQGGIARYQYLAGGNPPDENNPIDQGLIEGFFVVPESFDEISYLKVLHLKRRFDNTEWSLTIAPTIACNFACDYCFQRHHHGKMAPAVQQKLVDLFNAKASAGLKRFSVTWYGGEPTLAWDVIQNLSEAFLKISDEKGVDYQATIVTNGYLIDEKKVADMVRWRIRLAQITLDGDEASHDQRRILHSGKGTFSQILHNLQLFRDTPIFVHIPG